MQFETNIFCNFRQIHFAGFPDSSDHEGFQASSEQCRTQVYRSHGDNLVLLLLINMTAMDDDDVDDFGDIIEGKLSTGDGWIYH